MADDFFSCPEEPKEIRQNISIKADELGLVINPYMEHKIIWSENHGGRCMCDWKHRKCPCSEIGQDLIKYNGQCLCGVLVTKEKLEIIDKKKVKDNSTVHEYEKMGIYFER